MCCIAGPEFSEYGLQGHLLIILVKALHGLKLSGARFHEMFADSLAALKWFPSKADPDVWIKDMGEYYEHIMCTLYAGR